MSIEPLGIEDSDGDTDDLSFDMIPPDSIRYVQNCGVSSGGFITEDGGHEPSIFLKVVISRKANGPVDDDEELVLAFVPMAAHELSEALHYLSCPEGDEEE